MFIVEIAVRRIEWRKYYRFLRVIFLKRLILNVLLYKVVNHFGLDIKALEFCKNSFLRIFFTMLLLFEEVLNHVLLIIFYLMLAVCDLELVFFGI